MPVRRHADPSNVQLVWDSIESAKHHNHLADLTNICKFFSSETYCTPSQVELYLNQTLKDGLIVKEDAKGSKLLQPSDILKIPTEELTRAPDDGKDWYCIECHLAGDVIPCKSCHRVFHPECSRNVRNKQVVFQSIEKHNQSLILSNKYMNVNPLNKIEEVTKNTKIYQGSSTAEDNKKSSTSDKVENNYRILNFDDFVYDETSCGICNIHRLEAKCDLTREELNRLLGFILQRIKSWLPTNLTHTMAPDQRCPWNDDAHLKWRATQLFYQHVDMNIMDLKLKAKEYTKLIEFIADVVTIQHNVAIFHGIDSQEYGAAELMIRDTCHDISELRTCIDCYRHSNEKINNKWFCLPCRIPHKLVWAKQKGYPYWPAKVIKETESNYDVRFFGGKYERSLLPKNKKNVLPIEVKPNSQEIKKSTALNKALEELKIHQNFLENPASVKKYVAATPVNIVEKQTNKLNTQSKSPRKKSLKPIARSKQSVLDKSNEKSSVVETQKVSSNINTVVKRRHTLADMEPTPTKTKRRASGSYNKPSPTKSSVEEVIPISDGEEDELLTVKHYTVGKSSDGCCGQVSSSTEYFISNDEEFHNNDMSDVMHPLEQPYSDAVEKMRRKLEQIKDKKQLITTAMDCMQGEIDRISNEHNEQLKKLYDAHQVQISETKKKQWCYNCEQDAIYHCCWNTAYCSPTCQQQHWQAEHKKVCRRKR